MITLALAAVDEVNTVALAGAREAYPLWCRILGDDEAPLIAAALPISAAAIAGGLAAFEATAHNAQLAFGRTGLEPPTA